VGSRLFDGTPISHRSVLSWLINWVDSYVIKVNILLP
jgi:hypothetical protein